ARRVLDPDLDLADPDVQQIADPHGRAELDLGVRVDLERAAVLYLELGKAIRTGLDDLAHPDLISEVQRVGVVGAVLNYRYGALQLKHGRHGSRLGVGRPYRHEYAGAQNEREDGPRERSTAQHNSAPDTV